MKASATTAPGRRGFDRTGVVTARCRHAFLLAAADMTGGERFAYTLAIIARLQSAGLSIKRLWYDVGDGRFDATLKSFAPVFTAVRPMLPDFHARMHAVHCQLNWAGITQVGSGLPNSELSEQENRRIGLVGPLVRRGKSGASSVRIVS